MNRRKFISISLAAPIAAKAVVLNDFLSNGVYDINAALRTGPVTLLEQHYDCPQILMRAYDSITGVPNKSWIHFQHDGPGIMPASSSKPTELVTLRDFSIVCDAKRDARQHGIFLPSCWHWEISRMTIYNFGGTAVFVYGQRSQSGDLGPSDSTKHQISGVRGVACQHGFVFSGTTATERINGGTSNMNQLEHCLASQCRGYGFYIHQGAGNHLTSCIANLNAFHGFSIAWYGNTITAPVSERNDMWGLYFTNHKETRNNKVIGYHDGGSNLQGQANPFGTNVLL